MRTLAIFIASLAAVAALVVVSGCGDSGNEATADRTGAAGAATLPNRVTVTMGEWFFRVDREQVRAGKVTVTGRNVGDIEHELIALRTDLPADAMPMTHDGDELDLEKAGEIVIGEMHGHGGDDHMDGADDHADGADDHMDGADDHMDGADDHADGADDHMDEVDDRMDGAGEGSGEMVEAEVVEEGHLEAGESRRYEVNLKPGNYVLLCSIPGHYQAGQSAALQITAN